MCSLHAVVHDVDDGRAGMTPGTVVRGMGPYGSTMIRGYIHRRCLRVSCSCEGGPPHAIVSGKALLGPKLSCAQLQRCPVAKLLLMLW